MTTVMKRACDLVPGEIVNLDDESMTSNDFATVDHVTVHADGRTILWLVGNKLPCNLMADDLLRTYPE